MTFLRGIGARIIQFERIGYSKDGGYYRRRSLIMPDKNPRIKNRNGYYRSIQWNIWGIRRRHGGYD
jgi:hypothetical protein